jgi:hypothetical protein
MRHRPTIVVPSDRHNLSVSFPFKFDFSLRIPGPQFGVQRNRRMPPTFLSLHSLPSAILSLFFALNCLCLLFLALSPRLICVPITLTAWGKKVSHSAQPPTHYHPSFSAMALPTPPLILQRCCRSRWRNSVIKHVGPESRQLPA